MLKAYQYRIYPNQTQKLAFAQHFGHVRHVYNWALDLKTKTYEETGKSISRKELQALLVAQKKTEKPWLKEVNSQSLLAALLHLDTAFNHFFQGRAHYPKKKKKYSGHQSFQCPQHVSMDFENNKLTLPKIPGVDIRLHRVFEGKIKTVTIRKTPSNHYYASLLVESLDEAPLKTTIEPSNTLGFDMGLSHYLIDSEGNKIDHPNYLKNKLEKLRKTQKQFSRKTKKDSKNRAKLKKVVAIIHEKIAHQRHDFVHQLSADLVYKNHETTFAVEDLHIKGMIRNRKLARAIADSGWRKFISTLTYKCDWTGKNVITINRFSPSSKTCHDCHRKQDKMPLSVREWQCECGALHDRDINAARNIKAFALADALGYSACVKQFPYHESVQRRCGSERCWSYPIRVARSPHP